MSVPTPPPHPPETEAHLLDCLRRGDEESFTLLVEKHQAMLVRLALMHVADRTTAEEVAQEAWLAVLEGIGRFEGRSSLKTWLFRIVTNIAKTRGARESRSVPFSALAPEDERDEAPEPDPSRFAAAGNWLQPPPDWGADAESRLLSQEVRAVMQAAIDALPPRQRELITLRDVQGWSAAEVCNVLNLAETNQRVLLHRARSKVRQALERYFAGERP